MYIVIFLYYLFQGTSSSIKSNWNMHFNTHKSLNTIDFLPFESENPLERCRFFHLNRTALGETFQVRSWDGPTSLGGWKYWLNSRNLNPSQNTWFYCRPNCRSVETRTAGSWPSSKDESLTKFISWRFTVKFLYLIIFTSRIDAHMLAINILETDCAL
jgi:hypothetical protein